MADTEITIATDPVRQFSVFVENRVGRLFDLVSLLVAHNVHIVAMTTIDTTDSAVDRLIVDDPDRARELLAANSFAYTECDVLVVEFAGETQLKDVLGALLTVEINIHYAYTFMVRPEGRSALVLNLEDSDLAAQALNSRGFKTLTQRDISR
jgi:hypothetical protein